MPCHYPLFQICVRDSRSVSRRPSGPSGGLLPGVTGLTRKDLAYGLKMLRMGSVDDCEGTCSSSPDDEDRGGGYPTGLKTYNYCTASCWFSFRRGLVDRTESVLLVEMPSSTLLFSCASAAVGFLSCFSTLNSARKHF